MSKLKIGMAGILSAAVGFVMQGCFVAQPLPPCNVTVASANLGVPPYFAKLTPSGTPSGACTNVASSSLGGVQVGMQRFSSPGDPNFHVYIVTDYLAGILNGDGVAAGSCDDDLTNDCSNTKATGKCKYCVKGKGSAATFPDGGSAYDPATDAGVAIGLPDGGSFKVNLGNTCGVTLEAITRADDADPDQKNIYDIATTPLVPNSNNLCPFTATTAATQNLAAYTCADGTVFPAELLKTSWTNVEMVNSVFSPSTYFTGSLEITEGTCVSKYDAIGFWPPVDCTLYDENGDPVTDSSGNVETDPTICDPVANPDAGRTSGSGISPFFKPSCDTKLRICVPTASKHDLQFGAN